VRWRGTRGGGTRVPAEREGLNEGTMSRLRETTDAAQERETILVGQLTSCRVELASATERVEALGRELTRLDEIEADLRARLEQARVRRDQTTERGAWPTDEQGRPDLAPPESPSQPHRVEEQARGGRPQQA